MTLEILLFRIATDAFRIFKLVIHEFSANQLHDEHQKYASMIPVDASMIQDSEIDGRNDNWPASQYCPCLIWNMVYGKPRYHAYKISCLHVLSYSQFTRCRVLRMVGLFNFLVHERGDFNLNLVIALVSRTVTSSISSGNAFGRIPQDLIDEKSALVQVMVRWHQATNVVLSQI